MLSRSLSTSAKWASLHQSAGDLAEFCQILYTLMVAHADDFGRQAGDPFTVKYAVVPTSPRTVDEVATALRLLHDAKLIVWYEVEDRKVVQIVKFDDHQQGLHKRTASVFPEIPGTSGNFREIPSEQNRTEQKRTEEEQEQKAPPALRRAPLITTEHRSHAHCGRICLPAFLFSEFVRRRNHPDADREVRDWAMEVDRAWSLGGPHAGDEPGDALTFWRAQYQERWPPVLPPKVDTRLPEWAR